MFYVYVFSLFKTAQEAYIAFLLLGAVVLYSGDHGSYHHAVDCSPEGGWIISGQGRAGGLHHQDRIQQGGLHPPPSILQVRQSC